MLPIYSKQKMLLKLKGKKADDGYKRKKLKVFDNTSKNSPTPEPTEMEIEGVEGMKTTYSHSSKIHIICKNIIIKL